MVTLEEKEQYAENLIIHAENNNLDPMDLDIVAKSYYKESIKINNMIDSDKGRDIVKGFMN